MEFSVKTKHQLLALTLIYISVFSCKFGNAVEELPQTGAVIEDPAQILTKALLCFNNKLIYSSCNEAYRLTESGDLNIPPAYTDQYCGGPCLSETHLVLDCIESVLSHFLFYNKATVNDVKDTIKEGCGYGVQRGNFDVDVAEHVALEESRADKTAVSILFGLVLMIIGHSFLL